MRKLLVCCAMLGMLAAVNVGCNKNKDDGSTSGDPMKMSTDDCAMCPGTQTAKADGTCPQCGMKVK